MPSSGLQSIWIRLPSTDVLGFTHIVPQGGTSEFHDTLCKDPAPYGTARQATWNPTSKMAFQAVTGEPLPAVTGYRQANEFVPYGASGFQSVS